MKKLILKKEEKALLMLIKIKKIFIEIKKIYFKYFKLR